MMVMGGGVLEVANVWMLATVDNRMGRIGGSDSGCSQYGNQRSDCNHATDKWGHCLFLCKSETRNKIGSDLGCTRKSTRRTNRRDGLPKFLRGLPIQRFLRRF